MLLKNGLKIISSCLLALTLIACGDEAVNDNNQDPTTTANKIAPFTNIANHSSGETLPASNSQLLTDITFTDAKLAECVLATAKTFDWQQIEQLTQLKCQNKSIDSIGGIQNLSALESLELPLNNISELAPLAKLKSMTRLNLAANRLVNIEPLSELSNLRELKLGIEGQLDSASNAIRDITALSMLPNLQSLDLSHNQISDVLALKHLSNLTKLDLRSNQIRDISAFFDLPSNAIVNLQDNNNIACAELSLLESQLLEGQLAKPQDCIFTLDILITDIHFEDPKLKSCILDSASSEGWITIGEMTELSCDDQQLTDLTGMQSLKALSNVDLRNNQLLDISPLFALTATANIDLKGNEQVACARLDALDAVLGSGVVNRPLSCAPISLISDLDFIDPVLEDCVHQSAKLNHWKTINQMHTLSCELSDTTLKIKDLRGIEQLTALQRVNLNGRLAAHQDGVDLSALYSLSNTVQIDLSNHLILSCSELDTLSNRFNTQLIRPETCIK